MSQDLWSQMPEGEQVGVQKIWTMNPHSLPSRAVTIRQILASLHFVPSVPELQLQRTMLVRRVRAYIIDLEEKEMMR